MTTSTFTISHTIDQTIIEELEVEFDSFRARIAHLSLDVSSTLTSMFQPLGPETAPTSVIDIDAIEWDNALEIELVRHDELLELAAA